MFPFLLLIFIIVPVIEIYLLIQVGSVIGAGWTILAVIATAVIGSWLIRQEGMRTMAQFQQSVSRGQLPAQTIFDGVCLLLGGALLLTPGFFTDTIGFLLLVPGIRVALFKYFSSRKNIHVYSATSSGNTNNNPFERNVNAKRPGNTDNVIDVEDYHEIGNDKPKS